MKCSGCGCTEDNACFGGCYWVSTDPPVCSSCASEEELCPASPTPAMHTPSGRTVAAETALARAEYIAGVTPDQPDDDSFAPWPFSAESICRNDRLHPNTDPLASSPYIVDAFAQCYADLGPSSPNAGHRDEIDRQVRDALKARFPDGFFSLGPQEH